MATNAWQSQRTDIAGATPEVCSPAEYAAKHDGDPGTFPNAKQAVLTAAAALWASVPNPSQCGFPAPEGVQADLGVIGENLGTIFRAGEANPYRHHLLTAAREIIINTWSELQRRDQTPRSCHPQDAQIYGLWRNYCIALSQFGALVNGMMRRYSLASSFLTDSARTQFSSYNLPERAVPAEFCNRPSNLTGPPVGTPTSPPLQPPAASPAPGLLNRIGNYRGRRGKK